MADRGHRTVPHTADLRLEAWAPSRPECLAEALRGLIDSFADVTGAPVQRITERPLLAASDADMLAAAGEEIIYLLDAEGQIPVNLQVRPVTGGVVLVLALAAADAVEITGAVPKAISFHGLRCEQDRAGRWSASMTVDV
ncbi:MAG TPA: archease [Streptosporangiaceae bacterium]